MMAGDRAGVVWAAVFLWALPSFADEVGVGGSSGGMAANPTLTEADGGPVDPIEMEVLGFRLWMIIAFVAGGLLVIIIVLCCIFDCRIPRTKQEIEADHERRQVASQLALQLANMPTGHNLNVLHALPGTGRGQAPDSCAMNGSFGDEGSGVSSNATAPWSAGRKSKGRCRGTAGSTSPPPCVVVSSHSREASLATGLALTEQPHNVLGVSGKLHHESSPNQTVTSAQRKANTIV